MRLTSTTPSSPADAAAARRGHAGSEAETLQQQQPAHETDTLQQQQPAHGSGGSPLDLQPPRGRYGSLPDHRARRMQPRGQSRSLPSSPSERARPRRITWAGPQSSAHSASPSSLDPSDEVFLSRSLDETHIWRQGREVRQVLRLEEVVSAPIAIPRGMYRRRQVGFDLPKPEDESGSPVHIFSSLPSASSFPVSSGSSSFESGLEGDAKPAAGLAATEAAPKKA